MRKDYRDKSHIILYIMIGLFTVYAALICAPYFDEGLPALISNYNEIFKEPFKIELCENSLSAVLSFMLAYICILSMFLSGSRKMRNGEEFGSASFITPSLIGKKYSDRDFLNNKILTKNTALSLDGRKIARNANVLICGGSGSGKTRYYAKPNIMQCRDTSFIILDCKGELSSSMGAMLEQKGYTVKVLDLINMDKSFSYNPFKYLRSDADVLRLVTNLFAATTPKGQKSSDPFWDSTAQMFLLSLMFYLIYEAPQEEQNFSTVLDMIRAGQVDEDHSNAMSPLDELFEKLRKKDDRHIALKYYDSYRSASGKTLKSIQITLLSHLEKFDLSSLADMTSSDEMELDMVAVRPSAIFAVIPDNDDSFNFLIGMLYTQLFQIMYHQADFVYGGALPRHVHFIMDEFANVSVPDSFDKLLATMRSRNISVSIIIQNMAQLKKLFEKEWESIVGNCDTFLYLGGNELSTHEYVSKLLGKETIDIDAYSKGSGRNGNYSKNMSKQGRELLDSSEVRKIDNSKAILFIRGEKAVIDDKYSILKHPNISLTTDGGAAVYNYGEDEISAADISFDISSKVSGEEVLLEGISVKSSDELYEEYLDAEKGEKAKNSDKEN